MEIRTHQPHGYYHHGSNHNHDNSTYVDASIPKVAETPLEGNHSYEDKTFGPFETTPSRDAEGARILKSRVPNKKGHIVRFASAEMKENPVEKVLDSFFLCMDDAREATDTSKREGDEREGIANEERTGNDRGVCMNMIPETWDSDMELTRTLECVSDGLCRNPCADSSCVDSCTKMQPPVDLMLNVEDDTTEATFTYPQDSDDFDDEEPAPEMQKQVPILPSATPTSKDFALARDNSVKDMSGPNETLALGPDDEMMKKTHQDETKQAATDQAVPQYTPVETLEHRIRALLSDEVFQQIMDLFILETGQVREGAEELTIKREADSDPIVEFFDQLILFFDDFSVVAEEHRKNFMEVTEEKKQELLAKAKEHQMEFAKMTEQQQEIVSKMSDEQQEIFSNMSEEQQGIFAKMAENLMAMFPGETCSTDTEKASNTVNNKIKPPSMQMGPQEYAEALESAAALLSARATDEELQQYSQEELHRRALEKIMSERPDGEDGFTEYKNEAQILEELMKDYKDPDQIIREARAENGAEEEETESEEEEIKNATSKHSSHKENLVVLGHSATLTPIPEADEASANTSTPTSEKIAHGVMNSEFLSVPLFPDDEREEILQPSIPQDLPAAKSEEESPKDSPKDASEDAPEDVTEEEPEQLSIIDKMRGVFMAAVSEPEQKKEEVETEPEKKEGSVVLEAAKETESPMAWAEETMEDTADDLVEEIDSEIKKNYDDYEESDPIIRLIDSLFFCYEDIQEQKPCRACCGASVPSDLADPSEEVLDEEDNIVAPSFSTPPSEIATTSQVTATAVKKEHEAALQTAPSGTQSNPILIEPRPEDEDLDISRGQKLLEQALQVVKEASKLAEDVNARSADEMRITSVGSPEDRQIEADRQADLAMNFIGQLGIAFDDTKQRADFLQKASTKLDSMHGMSNKEKDEVVTKMNREISELINAAMQQNEELKQALSQDVDKAQQKVEFEIPESLKHPDQETCIMWGGGDDSELMASINADRKLSEMEHENIFRDVSKGYQDSTGARITRPGSQERFIYNALAFTEGSGRSSSL